MPFAEEDEPEEDEYRLSPGLSHRAQKGGSSQGKSSGKGKSKAEAKRPRKESSPEADGQPGRKKTITVPKGGTLVYRPHKPFKIPIGADRRPPPRKISPTERKKFFRQFGEICWCCGEPWALLTKWRYIPLHSKEYLSWVRWASFDGYDQTMCVDCHWIGQSF